jgi:outer membrane receptor protein involved in Fe transport
MKDKRTLVLALFAALLGHHPAWAQITDGSFRGVVADPSGAAVPGAKVELRDSVSQSAREATTDALGEYLLPGVPPGVYDFTVSFQGFQTLRNEHVVLQVGQHATLDFKLQPGELRQEIKVTGQAPLLNTANATIGTVVDDEKITQLPLNGRQFTQLILLTPGAAPQNTGLQGSYDVATNLGAVSPAVNGARSEMNNFTIDGVENNELYFNFVALNPPPDALQEFKVQSDMSSGAFGRAAGANVNVITRSGTNEYHGSAWEFLRNTSLDARNFFNPDVSPFHQNQYGFTLGGPIKKQKVFAFGWWEGFRKNLGSSIVGLVPTAAQLSGNLTGSPALFNPFSTRQVGTDSQGNPIFTRDPFPGNQIPQSLLNSTALNISGVMFPAPNLTGESGGNYINTQSLTTDTDQFGIRIDAVLPEAVNFFSRYSYSNAALTSPQLLPVLPTLTRNRMQQAVIGLNRAMGATGVLDFHAQFLRTSLIIYNPAPAPLSFLENNGLVKDFPPPVGIPPFMPGMCMSDNVCYGAQTWGPIAPINNWEYNGSYTKIWGKHTLVFGGSLIRTFFYENYNYGGANFDNLPTSDPANSANTGSGLASYLLGVPSAANQFVGSYELSAKGNYYGAYANDEWRVDPRLTLTLGLRYDYSSPFKPTSGGLASLDWDNSTPTHTIWLTTAANPVTGPANAPGGIYLPDRTDFAPRLGAAYRVKNDLVVRTGYGIFYDFNQSNIQDQQDIIGMWPWGAGDFQGDLNLPTPSSPVPTRILGTGIFPPFVFPTSPPYAPGFVANRHNRTPYVQNWNFGIDKSFGNNWLVSVTYLGSKGTDIPIEFPVNTADVPGPGALAPRQRLPQFAPLTIDGNWSNSSYNAGQVKIEKRTASGLAFLMSYSYSKSIDISSTVHGTSQPYNGVQNSFDIRASRGPSDFDLTQNFVTSVVYDLPFGPGKRFLNGSGPLTRYLAGGWQLTTIVTSNSGFPFTLQVPYDNANVGGGAQRPMLVGDLLPSGFQQTPSAWFNTSAVTVVPYTFGNLGRNTLRQDGLQNVDFGAFKQFKFTEKRSLEFRSEFFNLFNHPNFGAPNTAIGSPTFGQISSVVGLPRVVQFGLKVNF